MSPSAGGRKYVNSTLLCEVLFLVNMITLNYRTFSKMITLVQLVNNYQITQVLINITHHSGLFEDRFSSMGNSIQVSFKMF